MDEENRLGSVCSLRPYIATRFREETTMVSHPIQGGGDFSSPHHRSNENNDSQVTIAIKTMVHYKQTHCPSARDWLLEYYMRTFVHNAARRIAAGLPSCVDPEDLEQIGFFGLRECIEKYDPALQFKFETYARQRVEGSMRDYLRRIDPASRLARTRTKMIANGIEEFKAQHGRIPTDEELQSILNLDEKEFIAVMRDVHVPNTLPFYPADDDDAGGDGLVAMSIEVKQSGCELIDQRDLHEWLCNQLGTYDKLIVVLTYTEGLTMLEIGHTIGYSESRVSQRLKHIHAVLRGKIADEPEFCFLMAG
jgi:RNA polymerase sigma factor for flagellar operon FliA